MANNDYGTSTTKRITGMVLGIYIRMKKEVDDKKNRPGKTLHLAFGAKIKQKVSVIFFLLRPRQTLVVDKRSTNGHCSADGSSRAVERKQKSEMGDVWARQPVAWPNVTLKLSRLPKSKRITDTFPSHDKTTMTRILGQIGGWIHSDLSGTRNGITATTD